MRKKTIKVIFCGYRPWAIDIFNSLKTNNRISIYSIISSQDEYIKNKDFFPNDTDIILFAGWSWLISDCITNKYLCLGIHPSNLPFYRGGSPLQNQIINGIKKTKVSLFELKSKLDAGHVWAKNDLCLEGDNMDVIFKNLSDSSIEMLNTFFDKFPDIKPEKQDLSKGSYFKRRKPQDSELSYEKIKNMSLEQFYNFIRCLTKPYPNAYLKNKDGDKLFVKEIEFIKNKKDTI